MDRFTFKIEKMCSSKWHGTRSDEGHVGFPLHQNCVQKEACGVPQAGRAVSTVGCQQDSLTLSAPTQSTIIGPPFCSLFMPYTSGNRASKGRSPCLGRGKILTLDQTTDTLSPCRVFIGDEYRKSEPHRFAVRGITVSTACREMTTHDSRIIPSRNRDRYVRITEPIT